MKNATLAVVPSPMLETLAARINAEHRAIEVALKAGLAHAYNAGMLLIEAKDACPHGRWLRWVAENCEFSERTAQNYMRVAERWDELQGCAERELDCGEGWNKLFWGFLTCQRDLAQLIRDCETVRWSSAANFTEVIDLVIEMMRDAWRRRYVAAGSPWGEGEEGLDAWLRDQLRQAEAKDLVN
jgi:hypothetical protein